MRNLLFIILIAVLFPSISSAQRRTTQWKRTRYELIIGVGGTNILGELGGANRIGTNTVRDLEISMTRPLIHLGLRYKFYEKIAGKVGLTLGYLKGSDNTTEEISRNYRNITVRTQIVELALQGEYSFIKEKVGHRYNLRKVKGLRAFSTNTYIFAGIAGFYFNPQGKYQGDWYNLQPLGTEGQGVYGTREKYSRVQLSIPVGVGMKYSLDRKWSVGLEYGVRYTFTDYLDDVSTTYIDQSYFNNNPVAAYFADPSDKSEPNKTAAGQQRGDAMDNDAYMFMVITFTYKLTTTRKGLPKF